MASYEASEVRNSVTGPAIALLVTGILGVVVVLGNLVWILFFQAGFMEQMERQANQQIEMEAKQGKRDPVQVKQEQEQAQQMMKMMTYFSGTLGTVFAAIQLVVGVVVILGAVKMMRCQSYGLAFTSAILAMIPQISPCCCLGLPFGIWAVVVLSRAEVKAAFR
jgi:hypothetical protein